VVAVAETTTTTAAAMTEPAHPAAEGVSASAADRLAALRTPSKKKGRPAHASKILAAGLSTTAMLGLVTAMGWPVNAGSAQTHAPLPTALPTAPPTAVPVATVEPLLPATRLPAQPTAVPPGAITVATPVAEVPVPIAAGRTNSNTTTKTSG